MDSLVIEYLSVQDVNQLAKIGTPGPEFIDPVSAKTNPKGSFSVIENECFGLVLAKTGSINAAT